MPGLDRGGGRRAVLRLVEKPSTVSLYVSRGYSIVWIRFSLPRSTCRAAPTPRRGEGKSAISLQGTGNPWRGLSRSGLSLERAGGVSSPRIPESRQPRCGLRHSATEPVVLLLAGSSMRRPCSLVGRGWLFSIRQGRAAGRGFLLRRSGRGYRRARPLPTAPGIAGP